MYIYIFVHIHAHINTYIYTYPVPICSHSSDKKCAEILSTTNIVCAFVSYYLSLSRALRAGRNISRMHYEQCIHCTISNSLR